MESKVKGSSSQTEPISSFIMDLLNILVPLVAHYHTTKNCHFDAIVLSPLWSEQLCTHILSGVLLTHNDSCKDS